jgi:hypothetical protein
MALENNAAAGEAEIIAGVNALAAANGFRQWHHRSGNENNGVAEASEKAYQRRRREEMALTERRRQHGESHTGESVSKKGES